MKVLAAGGEKEYPSCIGAGWALSKLLLERVREVRSDKEGVDGVVIYLK